MRDIIFGPVKSRRLGDSLGIDLTPHKTCNLDCIYCECGKTTKLTNTRENYYKLEDILKEIDEAVRTRGHIDYITFSGSGEPALYKDIRKLISEIKSRYPHIKLAILTNSLFLTDKDVFDAFLEADLVLPSIDSVLDEGFNKINRPHPDIRLAEVLESLIRFKKAYKGDLWAEVFICPGINDTDKELTALAEYLKKLSPDKVQINTLDRPGTEKWLKPLDQEGLDKVLKFFKGLPVDVVSRKLLSSEKKEEKGFEPVLETLKRRPLTLKDIVGMSGHTEAEARTWIDTQIKAQKIDVNKVNDKETFYSIKK